MTALLVSPIVALTLASGSQPLAAQGATRDSARTVSRTQAAITPLVVSELRGPQTDPPSATPAPPPPPPPHVVPAKRVTVARPAPPKPKAAPAPRPTAGPPASPGSVIGIIEAAAARWGVSGSWMVGIARCESGLRPTAVNPSGPYIGLFQFLTSTFRANGGTNIWDATDQANIAAKMLAHGQAHQWSCA